MPSSARRFSKAAAPVASTLRKIARSALQGIALLWRQKRPHAAAEDQAPPDHRELSRCEDMRSLQQLLTAPSEAVGHALEPGGGQIEIARCGGGAQGDEDPVAGLPLRCPLSALQPGRRAARIRPASSHSPHCAACRAAFAADGLQCDDDAEARVCLGCAKFLEEPDAEGLRCLAHGEIGPPVDLAQRPEIQLPPRRRVRDPGPRATSGGRPARRWVLRPCRRNSPDTCSCSSRSCNSCSSGLSTGSRH